MNNMTKLAIVLGAAFAAYKYSGNSVAKTAAVAIGAFVVARQVPVVKDVLA